MIVRLVASLLVFLFCFPLFATIRGVVVDEKGAALAGVTVSAYAPASSDERWKRLLSDQPERVAFATTGTDERGLFSIDIKDAPSAIVQFTSEGRVPRGEMVAGDDDVGAIALRQLAPKKGRVTAGGRPVRDALIVIGSGIGVEIQARTDAAGHYIVPHPIEAGDPMITAIHSDYAIEPKMFETKSDSLDFSLQSGVTVTGRVVAEDGETPAEGAAISIDGLPLGRTSGDGRYSIDHVRPSWRLITASTGNRSTSRSNMKAGAGDLRLARAATVSGGARDARSGRSVAGVFVLISDASRSPVAVVTDAKGNFAAVVSPGTVRLRAYAAEHAFSSIDREVQPGENAVVNFAGPQFARVSGSVQDERKKPVVGVSVSIKPSPRVFPSQRPSATAPDGSFVLRRVIPEVPWTVAASKHPFPDATTGPLSLAAGERKKGVVVTLVPGLAVAVRVTDAHDAPLRDVALSARPMDARATRFDALDDVLVADFPTTDAKGMATLRLAEGRYKVTGRKPGYATSGRSGVRVGKETGTVELRLDRAVEISGRVLRPDKSSVADLDVLFFDGEEAISATTGPDGSFTLSGLPPGDVHLMFAKESEFISESHTLKAPARDFELVLDVAGVVSGRVFDRVTKRPLQAFQIGEGRGRESELLAMAKMRPMQSEDGTFILRNLPSGRIGLVIHAPGYVKSVLTHLEIPPDGPLENVEVALDPAVRVMGKVTGPGAAPLASVAVGVDHESYSRVRPVMTNSTGEYILDGLGAGEYVLLFEKGGFAPERKKVKLSGTEARVDASLSRGHEIRGTVVDEAGRGVKDARVVFRGNRSFSPAKSDSSGEFVLTGLVAERGSVSASAAGFAPTTQDGVDSATGGNSLRLVLKPGATIVGRVSGLTPAELARTFVRIVPGSEEVQVNLDGSYSFEGVPIGTIEVRASVRGVGAASRSSEKRSVEVTPGSRIVVDFQFVEGHRITGRVSRGGAPVAEALVLFFPETRAGTNASGYSGRDGEYEVSGVVDGEYRVNVMVDFAIASRETYAVNGSGTFDIRLANGLVRGHVVDAQTAEPLDGAAIRLEWRSSGGSFAPQKRSASSGGKFVFDSLPPGTYTLSASHDGYGQESRDIGVSDERAEDVELRLESSDGVTVSIVDANTGAPVFAFVTVVDAQGHEVHEAQAPDGTLVLPLSPGRYRLRVGASHYAPLSTEVISPSAAQRIAMTAGGTLELRSDREGQTLLRLLSGGVPFDGAGMTRPNGDLLITAGVKIFANVPTGDYSLQVLNGTTVEKTISFSIRESQKTSIDIGSPEPSR